jgi:hypothetical protein
LFQALSRPKCLRAGVKKGKQLGDRTYKVHLDGYNQMDLIIGPPLIGHLDLSG